ncbi:MAG: hypothetical protein ACRELU_04475, partial [Gemmatimonadota bacterium]
PRRAAGGRRGQLAARRAGADMTVNDDRLPVAVAAGQSIERDELVGALDLAERAAAAAERQALHARALAFDQPSSDRRIRVEASLPADLARLQEALRETA